MRRDQYRRLAIALAVLVSVPLVACRREHTGAPEAPIGGDLSRPLPYSDVRGLLRLHPGRPAWTACRELLGPMRQWATGTPLEPLVNVAAILLEADWLEPGTPLVVLALDPDVHGAMFGFAFRAQREDFLAAVDSSTWMRSEDGGRTIVAARRPNQRLIDLLPTPSRMMQSVRGESEPAPAVEEVVLDPWFEGSTIRYSLIEDEGRWLLLPQRDGQRNVAAVMRVTGVLDGALEGADYVRMQVGPLLKGSRDELRWAITTPLMGLAHDHDFQDFHRFRRQQRRLLTVAELVLDLAQGVEEVYALESDTEWGLYLRLRPGSLLDDLRLCLPEADAAELVHDAPPGEVVLGVSLDPDRLALLGQRILDRLRLHRDDEDTEVSSGFQRLWISAALQEPRVLGLLAREGVEGGDDEPARFCKAVKGLSEVLEPFFGRDLDVEPAVREEEGPVLLRLEHGSREVPAVFGFLPGRWLWGVAEDSEAAVLAERARLRADDPGATWQRHVSFPASASGVLFLQMGVTLLGTLDVDNSGVLISVRPGHRQAR